jgi:hypothetical protein
MGEYLFINDETKLINKTLKRFSTVDVAPYNTRLKGSFTIKKYRKYEFHEEVDIEFKGELMAKKDIESNFEWFKSDIYNQENVSKIKLNRLIKKLLFDEVKTYCTYFGIRLTDSADIKKINWV